MPVFRFQVLVRCRVIVAGRSELPLRRAISFFYHLLFLERTLRFQHQNKFDWIKSIAELCCTFLSRGVTNRPVTRNTSFHFEVPHTTYCITVHSLELGVIIPRRCVIVTRRQ
jgi:methionyl-tRNA synthetase